MKKLHIKIGDQWRPVFCEKQGQILTCENDPRKALPPQAIWADDDLAHFQRKYANHDFQLINI